MASKLKRPTKAKIIKGNTLIKKDHVGGRPDDRK